MWCWYKSNIHKVKETQYECPMFSHKVGMRFFFKYNFFIRQKMKFKLPPNLVVIWVSSPLFLFLGTLISIAILLESCALDIKFHHFYSYFIEVLTLRVTLCEVETWVWRWKEGPKQGYFVDFSHDKTKLEYAFNGKK